LRSSTLRQLIAPLIVFIIFATLVAFGDEAIRNVSLQILGKTFTVLSALVAVGAWLSAAYLLNRLINLFFWDRLVAKATGAPVPKLVTQLSGVIVYLLAITGIVGLVFEKSVTGLIATSGAFGIVLGFAVRSLILDLFTGLSINLERPFSIGEYIQVNIRGITGTFGRVEEVNWRTTRLLTPEEHIQIIPNSLVGAAAITNFSRPSPIGEFELVLSVDYAEDSDRVARVLMAGVRDATHIPGGPFADPEPKARVTGIDENGILYKVKYFINPITGGPGKVRAVVLNHLIKHMKAAGLSPAHVKQDSYEYALEPDVTTLTSEPQPLLARIDLFANLDEDEREILESQMIQRDLGAEETLIQEGDDLASMFVLEEGLLEIRQVTDQSDSPAVVGRVAPGEFFGELSLLTGMPHSATISAVVPSTVHELNKDHVAGLLERHPEFADQISATIMNRKGDQALKLEAYLEALRKKERLSEKNRLMELLSGQIRNFFNSGIVHFIGGLAGSDPRARMLDGAMAASALVACADGHVDEVERAHVHNTLEALDLLRYVDDEQGLEKFDAYTSEIMSDPDTARERLLGLLRPLSKDQKTAELVIGICQAISAADGSVDEEEEAVIRHITEALGR